MRWACTTGPAYFRQSLSADGWQNETYPSLDPQGLPLRLLTDASGDPALVRLSLPDSAQLTARILVAQVGRVPLLLLDSDVPENEHDLRSVTDRLYGGDQEHRIKQEILAGIGGVRAIRAFTAVEGLPAPEVFHMNEGHAGFLGTERIRELVTDAGLDFDTASDGGAGRHRVHHPHSGARRYRPVPGRDGAGVLRRSPR